MNAVSQPLGASPLPGFGEPKWESQDSDPEFHDREAGSQARKLKVIVIDDEALIADTVAAWPENKIIRQRGTISRILMPASIPFMPGMITSLSTTSGCMFWAS